jgi:hypothetical protein
MPTSGTSDIILLGGTYSTTNTSESTVSFEVYGITSNSSIGSTSSGAGAGKLTFVPLGTETVHLVKGFGIIAFAATVADDTSNPFVQFVLEDQSTKAIYRVDPDATSTFTSTALTVKLGEYTLMGHLFGGS